MGKLPRVCRPEYANINDSEAIRSRNNDVNNIPVRITHRTGQQFRTEVNLRPRTLKSIEVKKFGPTEPKLIPRFIVFYARYVVKPDAFPALCADLKCNNIEVCCISQTWLRQAVPSYLISPTGFCIVRKDRTNQQGGCVAIICRSD